MIRTAFILQVFLILASCADYNSSTFDQSAYNQVNVAGPIGIVMNRCASCHQHSSWNLLTTDQLWVSSGYVIKGSSANSLLIQKLYRNGGGGNMPPQNDLTQTEYTALKNWIDSMP